MAWNWGIWASVTSTARAERMARRSQNQYDPTVMARPISRPMTSPVGAPEGADEHAQGAEAGEQYRGLEVVAHAAPSRCPDGLRGRVAMMVRRPRRGTVPAPAPTVARLSRSGRTAAAHS